ncbi:MAG: hypothetical protein BGO54_05040 [Sphingobacteriales bacterium 46-32]|nr:MAG: hypothetical protein BGO54_05040 [Sphingobacteriales bacterium 46-32]
MQALTTLESGTVRDDSMRASFNKARKFNSPGRNNPLKNLVAFDPNTHSEAGWLSFGLSAKTVGTIMKFRQKGGRFRAPEDLRRIYGLHPDQAEQLIPYVQIPEPASAATNKFPAKSPSSFSPSPSTLPDINQADSTAWEALPGIGPKLASRIIKFREALGGFYQVSQVAEVFGLPDSVYQRIRPRLTCQPGQQIRLSLNEAGIEELSRHPYIRRSLASQIIAFRNLHGPFSDLQHLLQLHAMNDSILKRMLPYLRL